MTNYKSKCYLIAFMTLVIFMMSMSVSYAYNDKLSYKNLVGSNRYDTSVKISKEAYPNGAKNVIVVVGTSNVDGIITAPLAQKLSAPILLVQKDKVPDNIKAEVKRLKAAKVYLIGGSDVISDQIKNQLSTVGVTQFERIEGDTRYTTATAIAQKVNNFNKLIVCNSRDGDLNAAAVVGLAARNNIPILYSDSNNSINDDTYRFIENKTSKTKTIYLIGNGISTDQKKELEDKGIDIVKLTSKTPYDINAEMINKLGLKATNVTIVNNAVDAVSASYLAAKKGSLLIYAGTNLTAKQKNIVKDNAITKIYYTGGGKIKGPVKDVIYTLETKKVNSNPVLEFNKSKVVFYVPHQDDESLYYGQMITKAIKEKGANNVYVIMITDGAGSVLANKADVKTKLINSKLLKKNGKAEDAKVAFSKARDNEYVAACLALGVKKDNILFNENIGQKRLKDGKVVAADVKATMKYYDNKFKGDVTHVTYTFKFDYHEDHRDLGTALNELYYDLSLREDSFTSVYFIIRANYTNQNGSISGVKLITLKEIINGDKIKNALNIYLTPYESSDLSKVRIGIGGMSVKGEINTAIKSITNKKLTTRLHLPY